MLHDLSVLKAADVDHIDPDRFASRGQSVKTATMGAAGCEASPSDVLVGTHFLDSERQVWEKGAQAGNPTFHALQGWRRKSVLMLLEVWREKLIERS
jgi:hypothetical protein